MAQKLNALCARFVGIGRDRVSFIEELETVWNSYTQRTAGYLREVQARDEQKVLQLHMLVAELELNARNNDVFIMKLKGEMRF